MYILTVILSESLPVKSWERQKQSGICEDRVIVMRACCHHMDRKYKRLHFATSILQIFNNVNEIYLE